MQPIEVDPRRRFFNEEGDSLPPFVVPGWRGGVLDPDGFDHTKIPRSLFESIVRAARSDEIFLRPYTPDAKSSVQLDPSWGSFHAHRCAPDNWSLEYVLYDGSGRWAVLLNPDALVVGAADDVAETIDEHLRVHGTSLVDLTHQSFPDLEAAPFNRYVLAVLGGQRDSGAP